MNLAAFVVFVLLQSRHALGELFCVQCDRSSNWYSPEENARIIDQCQHGRLAPTRCANDSATHCLYSYYKTSTGKKRTIMERRCGGRRVEEIVGCTLYKSGGAVPQRVRRHLFSDGYSNPRRRDTKQNFFVEVCTGGCQGDGCITSVASLPLVSALLFVLVRLLL